MVDDIHTKSDSVFRIAAVVTSYFPNSHADVLVGKFIQGFPTDAGLLPPRSTVVSLYIEQHHARDIGRQVAHRFGIRLHESIRAALTLGGDDLAVDAVLLIGEHGDYPITSLGQEMLPRRHFFEQIAAVIAAADRPIPVYNDKHLAYRWDDARWMVETATSLQVPLWAGSAVPMAWRCPHEEHPDGAGLDEAMAVGFHMVERYGFHALEVLQSQVERRRGGETGVRAVQCLSGEAVWAAGREQRWSMTLAQRALAAIEGSPDELDPDRIIDPHVFIIEYVDGLQGAVLMLGEGFVHKFSYVERCGTNVTAWEYHLDSGLTHAAFGYLGRNIEDFFLSGTPPTPLDRTLLTTGVLEAAMISRGQGGERVETPHLANLRYRTTGVPLCPTAPRPCGASLSPWPNLDPGATPAAVPIPTTRDGTTTAEQRRVGPGRPEGRR